MEQKDKHHLSSSEGSDDEVDEVIVRKQNIKTQRSSVSAECFGTFNKKENFKPRFIKKNQDVIQLIEARLNNIFMFSALEVSEKQIVIGAMEEKVFKAGDWVIKQGDEGDVLYTVESGQLDCFKKYTDKPEPVFLKTYQPGELFGELALLYNAPRAASIQAKTDCRLFALDRATFKNIVQDSAMKRREKFDEFLKQWSLLSSIDDDYEKCKIADAFQQKTYSKGETIVEIGSSKGDIFILLEGNVSALDQGNKDILQFSTKGDYFGEIPALFKGKKQPFNFVATSENVTGVFIPNSSYKSSLKIVEKQLVENAAKYSNFI